MNLLLTKIDIEKKLPDIRVHLFLHPLTVTIDFDGVFARPKIVHSVLPYA